MSEFRFRRFAVQQDRCAMKVGTDGVLLGAWAHTGRMMLDIGTGTGLIALMMAQRNEESLIDGIDIDEEAVAQAKENVAASPFASRIRILHGRIQEYQPTEATLYDSIVSNPPFFHNSLGSPDTQRQLARHTDSLTYRHLFDAVQRLLAPDGCFSVVLPFDCRDSFVDEALLHGMMLSRECGIRTTPRKQPRRYLMEFRFASHLDTTGSLEKEEVVLMDDRGGRSEWYQRLTQDFYL